MNVYQFGIILLQIKLIIQVKIRYVYTHKKSP